MNYILKVKYKGKADFYFYSPCFVASSMEEALKTGQQLLAEAWEKISPHPAPDEIVDVIAGVMGIFRDE